MSEQLIRTTARSGGQVEMETIDGRIIRMTESELAAAWNNQAQTVLQLQLELRVARSEATQAKAQAAMVTAERDQLRQELAEARGYINNRFVDECAWCGKQFSPHEHTLATEHTGHCEQNPIIKERDAARQSRARLLGYLYSIDEILPPMPASNPFYRTILGRVRLLKDQLRYLEQKP